LPVPQLVVIIIAMPFLVKVDDSNFFNLSAVVQIEKTANGATVHLSGGAEVQISEDLFNAIEDAFTIVKEEEPLDITGLEDALRAAGEPDQSDRK